ncbi:SRPBCC family protein [Thermomonospora umbrina]|uniref:Polyketide cyclase/dehydrase/lipid transport protein n=1 Tax=Thermomonospora umbrina TaxID=111806 RepID=A0A3D9T2X5_9ACTN|nr:SRPBCC family protein [Thermomonospora umbrina]REF00724.1 polyketide cyclase/dehydrase/lipid transport protein [Thermomonospora umbrina]
MGTVSREIAIDAAPEKVWDAISDFVNGPLRMGPGVFTGSRLVEPGVRELTFADGTVARERLISRDEQARRMVWGWIGDEVEHDNTSMQVFADGTERSRLVWTHDTLPDELTGWLSTAMDQLLPVFQKALRSPGEAQRP